MTAEDTIKQVASAHSVDDIPDFKAAMVAVHPDRCSLPGASEAAAKLNKLRDRREKGDPMRDESGPFLFKERSAVYTGDAALLKRSQAGLHRLLALRSPAALNFHKYLPSGASMRPDGSLEVTFRSRVVPLVGLKLDQRHVNWVLSRLLEVSAWMAQEGFSHGGINPTSVFVDPVSHGIQIATFYTLARIGEKPPGVSGPFAHWYPAELFSGKAALPWTDLELSKRTAVCLLGDKSGVGVRLRADKSVNADVIGFVLASHTEPAAAYKAYRDVLARNFKKEYVKLDL